MFVFIVDPKQPMEVLKSLGDLQLGDPRGFLVQSLSHDMVVGTITDIGAHSLSVTLTEASGTLPVGTIVTVATAHAKMTRTGTANFKTKPSGGVFRSMSALSHTNAPKTSMSDFAIGDTVTVVGALDTNKGMKAKQIVAHAKNDFHISQPVK